VRRHAARTRRGAAASRRIPGWLSGTLVLGAFATLVFAETRRPLRRPVEPKLSRDLRNLAVAALSAATLQALEKPVVEPLARAVERRRFGLLQWLRPPRWLEVPLAAALMDYTLYLWHVLTHRVPFLWRLHVVHHADLDLSATTALRFHGAEMAVSVPWRAAQVALLGVGPRALSVWQTLLFASILFHHSNLRLPPWLERRLVPFIVTPRMHGIHHSVVQAETDSNWSSGLTLWDRLHRTLRLDVPQDRVTIGVPAWRDPAAVTLPRLLAMPFARQPPSFVSPDGRRPGRRGRPAPERVFPGA
jgi:sterol desaturase/sphingolipid hydroxylase (fatty acid hydroxylase superfamily)